MKNFFLITLFFLSTLVVGQSKKLWFKLAEDAFNKKEYPTAINYYTQTVDDSTILNELVLPYEIQLVNLKSKSFKQDTSKKVSLNPKKKVSKSNYINHQLAQCYRLNKDYENAYLYYKKVVENNSYPDDAFHYAQSLMHIKNYNEANILLEKLIETTTNDSIKKVLTKNISSCNFSLDTNNYKRKISVKKMDSIIFNIGTANFAPMYFGSSKKLLFTSARKGGVLLNPEQQDSQYLCDLYYTELKDSGWIKPVNFGRPVNTGLHEGACVVTDNNVMFFTRWNDENKNDSYIYMAKMKDDAFFEAYKLNETVNKQGYKAMHPFLSADGTKMFFSSNMLGGYGGFDLYMCNIDENGTTGIAKNLGPNINTNFDEVTPFFHSISKTLFFSSNGHTGVGGLDVFKSSLNTEDSSYSAPKNLVKPINSSKDDAYFILDRFQSKGYFSSDREDCLGGNCYDIYEFENEPIIVDLKGYVYEDSLKTVVPGALVTIKDIHNDINPVFTKTDENGYYFSPLHENVEYFVKAQKKDYFANAENISTIGLTETAHFVRDLYLTKIPAGDIIIEGIEYDFDKATLRPKSIEIMNQILELMILNDNMSIEINSHTDTRGSDVHNLKLSQARAQSCLNYLISNGIKAERLIPTGYGETKPLISDEEIAEMIPESEEFEAAHQRNRRTAFKVIYEGELKTILRE